MMKINFRQVHIAALTMAITTCAVCGQAARLKDIASVEGVRANQLQGLGLVIGLDGTGDSQQAKFTPQSIANMLQEMNLTVSAAQLKVKNVAAVIVTATLPPFARKGNTIDITCSSLGDCRSLQGGTLLLTALKGVDGEVYALAQGPVTVGGFSAGGSGGGSVAKNHTTVGRIPGGAIIEEETKTDIATNDVINITLNQNDFTTAYRAANAIDDKLGGHYAKAIDSNVIAVTVPDEYKASLVMLMAEIESVDVKTDTIAKVIINERTGTVVIGGSATISPCAVAHGSLTVTVTTETGVSQPAPLSKGKTAVVNDVKTNAEEEKGHLIELKSGTTIGELVQALNALKVTPRDLMSILQQLKEGGYLQAQLEVI